MLPEFRNESLTNFTIPENRQSMEKALSYVESQLGRYYPLIIGGERLETDQELVSINPSNKDEVVGRFAKGTKDMAEKAIETAWETFQSWRWTHPDERARYLIKAAAIARRRKLELAAWMVFEEGKNWVEADADVAEAIDFLEFYGREMMRLGERQPVVLVGMTSASLVTGNTVVLKPASTAPAIAAQFVDILEEAGLPPGVVNFLPGPGGAIGDTIVGHPLTRFIAFTGSREVGLHIHELAAKQAEGQIWIKRTILEMGGKDFIAVDQTADLDAAADAIVVAAYGFQGQKCSACSRAIVEGSVYDAVLERVVEKVKKLTVGPVKDHKNYMGPVIDQLAYDKILSYIEIGKKEGRLMCGGGKAHGNGFFIQPTVFADIKPDARLAQEEIFGPVLAFIKARDFDHLIETANGTEYGLTGALFSTNRAHLERGRRELHVGNLYLNRKCTGALVGVQPFGGFNMSGTDSKAGGRDYLLLFTQAKSVAERF
jgi:1-pyrroline-5-carboxylate dehydrogenase